MGERQNSNRQNRQEKKSGKYQEEMEGIFIVLMIFLSSFSTPLGHQSPPQKSNSKGWYMVENVCICMYKTFLRNKIHFFAELVRGELGYM